MKIFKKQPNEIRDVNFTFVAWLAARPSAAYVSHVVTADPGVTVASDTYAAGVVTVTIAGGLDATDYKVTVRLTTSGLALVREAECIIRVKEE